MAKKGYNIPRYGVKLDEEVKVCPDLGKKWPKMAETPPDLGRNWTAKPKNSQI